MFFFLSKILLLLIYPFTWITILLIYGLITKNKKKQKVLLIISVTLILFFSNPLLFNFFASRWERPVILEKDLRQKYTCGIVLSGMMNYNDKIDDAEFSDCADRFFKAIELYKTGKIEKILLSGGSGNIMSQDFKEAQYLKNYLLKIGVPDSNILLEENSRNTHENALFSIQKFRLDTLSPGSCMLITSAFHMRRASACFKKEGLSQFDCYSTDYLSFEVNSKIFPPNLIVPNPLTIYKWNILIKEWVGYVSYKMAGYI
jgi:uncharacterized SAM-binding protein YcdF (DUF218 family)